MGSVAGSLQQFIYIFYEKRYALKVSPSTTEREPPRILPSDRSTGFFTESALDDLLILTVLAVVHPSVPVSARGTLSVIVQLVVVILTHTTLVVSDKALFCLCSVFVLCLVLTAYGTRLPAVLTRALSVSAPLTSVLIVALILTLLVALTAYSIADDQLIVRCWFLALTAVLLLSLEETSSAVEDAMRRFPFLDDCWIRTLCPTLLA